MKVIGSGVCENDGFVVVDTVYSPGGTWIEVNEQLVKVAMNRPLTLALIFTPPPVKFFGRYRKISAVPFGSDVFSVDSDWAFCGVDQPRNAMANAADNRSGLFAMPHLN